MFGWLTRMGQAIDRAVERRLRRASGLDAAGRTLALHHDAGEASEDGDVEIANVARGTTIMPPETTPADLPAAPAFHAAPSSTAPAAEPQPAVSQPIAAPAAQTEADEGEEAEIVNLPPGSTT